MLASHRARRGGVGLEHDGLLGRDQFVRPERGPGDGGVLRRHEIRMRACRSIAGELRRPSDRAGEHRSCGCSGVDALSRPSRNARIFSSGFAYRPASA